MSGSVASRLRALHDRMVAGAQAATVGFVTKCVDGARSSIRWKTPRVSTRSSSRAVRVSRVEQYLGLMISGYVLLTPGECGVDSAGARSFRRIPINTRLLCPSSTSIFAFRSDPPSEAGGCQAPAFVRSQDIPLSRPSEWVLHKPRAHVRRPSLVAASSRA